MAEYTLPDAPFPIGSQAPDFKLKGVDGRMHGLDSYSDAQVLCVVFMCNHCPYVQAYVERLIELQEKFGPQGVQLVGINPNDASRYPDDSYDAMVEDAERVGLNFPYLHDETQSVAKAYHAERTPQVFVFDADRKLRYTGGIDDNYQDESAATRHPLRDALEDLLAGREVREPEAHFIGCSVKWKQA